MCDFNEAERSEQIIVLIVASTQHGAFQKHLLNQEVEYDTDMVLSEGHKYEAMEIGKQAIQTMEGPSSSVNATTHQWKCTKCGLYHIHHIIAQQTTMIESIVVNLNIGLIVVEIPNEAQHVLMDTSGAIVLPGVDEATVSVKAY